MRGEYIAGSFVAVTFVALQEKINFILEPIQGILPVPEKASSGILGFVGYLGILGFVVGYLATKLTNHIRWVLLKALLNYTGWIANSKSRKTKIFGFLLQLLSPSKPKLFEFQKILPRLPLPKLEDTCSRIVDTVLPLLTDEELLEVKSAVEELKNVDGPHLQAILEERYKTESNWVEEYWEKFAYLSARCGLPVNLNYSMLSPFDLTGATQCSRAAMYAYLAMKFKHKIDTQDLLPLRILNLIPICMHRYHSLFSCTRLPGKDIDQMKYYNSNHIVVFRNGHMYKVDMFCMNDKGRKVLMSPLAIQKIFERIVDAADHKTVHNPAPFTSMDRTSWHHIRNKLLESESNAASLETVESAIFCVSLDKDEDNVSDPSGLFRKFLAGDSYHRWFDKSFVIIARSNSAIGLNCEHTTAEATLYGRYWEYAIVMGNYDADCNAVSMDGLDDNLQTKAEELLWDLDGLTDQICEAADAFKKLAANLDCCVHITTKGKGVMKQQRISPDGFIQMAMQLAFYRQNKVTPKTYETGSTRLFYHGRTETIRPVSDESVLFTKTFDDPSVSLQEKVAHLRAAVTQQCKNKFMAMSGNGIDRHLFALYVTGKLTGKIPKLFTLKPFSETDRLSTSNSPISYDLDLMKFYEGKEGAAGGGFGPQHAQGYGIAYFLVGEDKIHLIVSSYKSWSSAKTFAGDIETAIDDQIKLLVECRKLQNDGSNKKKK